MYKRKRVDPRVIGSFVIGAIILVVAGLLFFGPGGFISETNRYELHFGRSVKGLNVGSPVRFRGVKIGQVKHINVQISPADLKFHIPVIIEIEPARIGADDISKGVLDTIKSTVKGDDPIQRLVKKGLRAQLQLDSLVTGQLFVNFDMHPDTPITNVDYQGEYPALPTIPSGLEELTKTFADLPLRELADKLINSAEGFERLMTSPNLHNGLAKFDDVAGQLNTLLKNLNGQLLPLVQSLRQTLEETKMFIGHIDSKIEPLAQDIKATGNSFESALNRFSEASQETAETMESWKTLAENDSRLQQQLVLTLLEIGKAARSVRYLSTEFERDPQVLLRGRSDGANQ
ncbi:MAG: hypothetical protein BA864_09975 [Desulfuromonadales bacterium C00003093]|nr:MAG: hypothetical protein BA864_09975 [Desulfuromonadales bacterium C00003093]